MENESACYADIIVAIYRVENEVQIQSEIDVSEICSIWAASKASEIGSIEISFLARRVGISCSSVYYFQTSPIIKFK